MSVANKSLSKGVIGRNLTPELILGIEFLTESGTYWRWAKRFFLLAAV